MVHPSCMCCELLLASPPLRDGLLGGLAVNLRTRLCLPHGQSNLVNRAAHEEAVVHFSSFVYLLG